MTPLHNDLLTAYPVRRPSEIRVFIGQRRMGTPPPETRRRQYGFREYRHHGRHSAHPSHRCRKRHPALSSHFQLPLLDLLAPDVEDLSEDRDNFLQTYYASIPRHCRASPHSHRGWTRRESNPRSWFCQCRSRRSWLSEDQGGLPKNKSDRPCLVPLFPTPLPRDPMPGRPSASLCQNRHSDSARVFPCSTVRGRTPVTARSTSGNTLSHRAGLPIPPDDWRYPSSNLGLLACSRYPARRRRTGPPVTGQRAM